MHIYLYIFLVCPFAKILSSKFQFHSIMHKALRTICLNRFHLGNTAIRIRSFRIIYSSSDISGFLVKKKALKDTGADLGRKGARVPRPLSCIFEKKIDQPSKERDYSFGFGRRGRGSAHCRNFDGPLIWIFWIGPWDTLFREAAKRI